MTKEQYEKYKKLNEEVENIKNFLFYCGKRYRHSTYVKRFLFNILRVKIFEKRFKLNMPNAPLWWDEDISLDIPEDLQERIIDVIEDYVDEKEKELEEI